jgi:hypothetical protein
MTSLFGNGVHLASIPLDRLTQRYFWARPRRRVQSSSRNPCTKQGPFFHVVGPDAEVLGVRAFTSTQPFSEDTCALCSQGIEAIDHLLKQCPFTREV